MSTRARNVILAIITIGTGFALPMVFGEIVLRFLPVSGGAYTTAVNAAQPILHFEPNRTFTAAVGPRLEYANRGKINNAGWVSDQTYDSTATTPLLALIGDSYIEAFIVPYRESLQGRLAEAARPSHRVYAFGMSGWPLSQYLAVAEFVAKRYRPEAMVVTSWAMTSTKVCFATRTPAASTTSVTAPIARSRSSESTTLQSGITASSVTRRCGDMRSVISN